MKGPQFLSRGSALGVLVLACLAIPAFVAPAATVNAFYNSATNVPVTANGYTATSNTVNFTLNFAPVTGTDLTVVLNTALNFINGAFDNLTNGQPVILSYAGTSYHFVANYYGGSGNDLLLVWANNRAFGWGLNNSGQIGDHTYTWPRPAPVPVDITSAPSLLSGKTIVALAAGYVNTLALCSDGTLAGWGNNEAGTVGNNSYYNSFVPVAVNIAPGVSALYGKRVVSIAVGYLLCLALCSDGTVAAWGDNGSGAIGDNRLSGYQPRVPVAVNTNSGLSALYGKTVVAIGAAGSRALALCSDGTLTAWGENNFGQIGDNATTNHLVPVAVNMAPGISALNGKMVVAIAVGDYHSLALCSDGTLAAWGRNNYGQLGDNTTTNRLVPVAVNMASGVSALFGKTIVAIEAGLEHSLALCSDGTVAAWGHNDNGQLGDNTTTTRLAPVAVNTNSVVSALYGKSVVAIAAGSAHSTALCSDGTLAAWGYNYYGQLGDNTTTLRKSPVAVNTTILAAAQRFAHIGRCPSANHTMALVAAPPAAGFTLNGPRKLTNGSFQFAFTNTPGAFFGVLATTNLALPVNNWTPLAGLSEVSSGQFLFTDPQATNNPQCFYRVRSP